MRRLTSPPTALKKGDVLGIVAPAGQMQNSELFEKGLSILSEMGFELKFPRDHWPGRAYLSDTDENRAKEINNFFKDPEIDGLISMRGGYGCLRILEFLDLDLIACHPKLLVGFSDITILQNYLFDRIGLVSLHGPVVTGLARLTKEALDRFFYSVTGKWRQAIPHHRSEVLKEGCDVSAPLIGGNLASLSALLGTAYDICWDDKIIFLEDINEPIYKIDRMLTQLKLSGKFNNIKGLILGDFSDAACETSVDKLRYKESVWGRVLEICSEFDINIWADFPAGHCPCNLTFPLGAVVNMDGAQKRLSFL